MLEPEQTIRKNRSGITALVAAGLTGALLLAVREDRSTDEVASPPERADTIPFDFGGSNLPGFDTANSISEAEARAAVEKTETEPSEVDRFARFHLHRVKVIDSNGNPIDDARLTACVPRTKDRGYECSPRGTRSFNWTTYSDGIAELDLFKSSREFIESTFLKNCGVKNFLPGTFEVTIAHPLYCTELVFLEFGLYEKDSDDIPETTITLERGSTLNGIVLDKITGEPIEDAYVEVGDHDGSTDKEGRIFTPAFDVLKPHESFPGVSGLPRGAPTFPVVIHQDGYYPLRTEASLSDHQQEFLLEPVRDGLTIRFINQCTGEPIMLDRPLVDWINDELLSNGLLANARLPQLGPMPPYEFSYNFGYSSDLEVDGSEATFQGLTPETYPVISIEVPGYEPLGIDVALLHPGPAINPVYLTPAPLRLVEFIDLNTGRTLTSREAIPHVGPRWNDGDVREAHEARLGQIWKNGKRYWQITPFGIEDLDKLTTLTLFDVSSVVHKVEGIYDAAGERVALPLPILVREEFDILKPNERHIEEPLQLFVKLEGKSRSTRK